MARPTLEDVVARIGETPRLPLVASQLLSLFKDAQAGTADIKRVLVYDPEFSSRVVQVAQGIAERNGRKINDLNMAVNYLGFETLKSVVVLVGIMKALPDKKGAIRFQADRFWRHSLAAGITYRYLARKKKLDADTAFLSGILHDIGKLLINHNLPSEMEQMLLMSERAQSYMHTLEALVLDTSHGEVGAWLAESWGVSEEIVYFICHHHNVEKENQLVFPMASLADKILSELGMSSPGSCGDISDEKESLNIRQLCRELKPELQVINYIFPEQHLN